MGRPRPALTDRLLPGVAQLRGYQRSWLRGDVLAGLTVAAYLVPQVMAYGALAGLPPVTGLWAILAPLALYALVGSSRQLSVGPESTTALMTAVVVAPLAGGQPARYAALAAALAVVVGLMCLLAFATRLGFVADLLSKPILVGYLAGVAMIMVVGQLGKLTGVPVTGDTFAGHLASFVRHLPQLKVGTLLFAAAVLAFLLIGQWRLPALPVPLLAVLLATLAVVGFDLQSHGISVVGPIPQGLPAPALPDLDDLRQLLLPAAGVLVVGYTDTVLTARAFAARGGYVTRSHSASTSDRMWLDSSTARPAPRSSRTTSWNTASIKGSRPDVGSSSRYSSTSEANAATSATFCRLPLE